MEIEILIELKINIKIKDNKLFSRISKFKEAIMQIRLLSLNKDKSKVFKIQIIKKNKQKMMMIDLRIGKVQLNQLLKIKINRLLSVKKAVGEDL